MRQQSNCIPRCLTPEKGPDSTISNFYLFPKCKKKRKLLHNLLSGWTVGVNSLHSPHDPRDWRTTSKSFVFEWVCELYIYIYRCIFSYFSCFLAFIVIRRILAMLPSIFVKQISKEISAIRKYSSSFVTCHKIIGKKSGHDSGTRKRRIVPKS